MNDECLSCCSGSHRKRFNRLGKYKYLLYLSEGTFPKLSLREFPYLFIWDDKWRATLSWVEVPQGGVHLCYTRLPVHCSSGVHTTGGSRCLWEKPPKLTTWQQENRTEYVATGTNALVYIAGCNVEPSVSWKKNDFCFPFFFAFEHLGLCLHVNTKYQKKEKGGEMFCAPKCTVVIPPAPFACE